MNILATLNRNYLFHFLVMVDSLMYHHPHEKIDLYLISNDISLEDIKCLQMFDNLSIHLMQYHNQILAVAKTTYRYPPEIYTRLYAIEYLPNTVERILYLDPDIIVLKNLKSLYEMDFQDNYYIGATNVKGFLTRFNNWKNKAAKGSKYLNTGVLLINIEKLRKEQNIQELNEYIIKNEKRLFLPDQDVLNALYGNKVIVIDNLKYNLSDRAIKRYNLTKRKKINHHWVDENAYIIHYYGKNKPWKDKYRGILKPYYEFHAERVKKIIES